MIWTIFFISAIIIGVCIGFVFAKFFARRSRFSVSQMAVEENVNSLLASAQSQREIILNEAIKTAKEQYEAESVLFSNEIDSLIKINESFDLKLNEKQSEIDKRDQKIKSIEGEILKTKKDLQKANAQVEQDKRSLKETKDKIEKLKKDPIKREGDELLNSLKEKLNH